MRVIRSSFVIIPQEEGLEGVYKQIELAGRTCYHSQDKITEDSAKSFVERMIKSNHTAMLEHGTVYLVIPVYPDFSNIELLNKYINNPYTKVNYNEDSHLAYITTNYRTLVENKWLDDLKYISVVTDDHEKRITVKFITDQGVMREATRHRRFSYAVESTRYCNYSLSKFNNEVTFIIPSWANIPEGSITSFKDGSVVYNQLVLEDLEEAEYTLAVALNDAEHLYLDLLKQGLQPQQARQVLPLATKCDMVMTGFVSDWSYFFDLRARGTTGAPHPDMKALAEPLMNEFYERNLLVKN